MNQRLVVISDLHIAPPGPLCSFFSGEKLADFFEAQARADTTLMLAGDVIDFLQIEPRPSELDMKGAPAMLDAVLGEIEKASWGKRIFAAWKALLDRGGRLVLMPGNHDPELFHPETPEVLRRRLGLETTKGIVHHTEEKPWLEVVGDRPVWVVHGNRVDHWNDIDPARVKEAVLDGQPRKLPPGSRLVLEVMNPLKKLVDKDGHRVLAFVDLLKPEIENVLLLVPYLNWKDASAHLPRAGKLLTSALLLRKLERLISGQVLGPDHKATVAVKEEEWLAEAIAAMLEPEERHWPSLQKKINHLISPPSTTVAGTLASHDGARKWAARRYLEKKLSRDGSFFDKAHLSGEDTAIINEHLAEGTGPRVVIAGHTHAARWKEFGDGRVYLNTGTWMDLMRLPDLSSDQETKDWIDKLEAGKADRFQRLTYVEVTTDGPRLLEWP